MYLSSLFLVCMDLGRDDLMRTVSRWTNVYFVSIIDHVMCKEVLCVFMGVGLGLVSFQVFFVKDDVSEKLDGNL